MRSSGSRPRGAPAGTAKIVTAGASATAMLGLIAVYGAVDRASASSDQPPTAIVDPVTVVPAATPIAAPAPSAPPVVIVMVDAGTGEPLRVVPHAETSIDPAVVESVAAVVDESPAPAPAAAPSDATSVPATPVPDPQPVQPTAIDLAVPAPPPPPPPSAAAPAPAAPAPAATSSGS